MGDLAQAEVLWGMRVGGRQAVRNLCARGREGCCRGPNFLVHSAVISAPHQSALVLPLRIHSLVRSFVPSRSPLSVCSLMHSFAGMLPLSVTHTSPGPRGAAACSPLARPPLASRQGTIWDLGKDSGKLW